MAEYESLTELNFFAVQLRYDDELEVESPRLVGLLRASRKPVAAGGGALAWGLNSNRPQG